uniref:Dickkopf N-terminal cysteine-rich domain-containing protein n=1 Tax=Leptobrachium leishanense TaxID=445787 RepID=A0A8C5QTJ6_9ANUR
MLAAVALVLMLHAVSSVPIRYHSNLDGVRDALKEMAAHNQACNSSSDCPDNRFCNSTNFTSDCQECKPKEMECEHDGECCFEHTCVWGRCSDDEGVVGGNGTRCDPSNDHCAPGFCCSKPETLPFPVCVPFPTEGDQCRSQASKLLSLIHEGSAFGASSGYCPCAEGLVCTNKGVKPFLTCEKPDNIVDFTAYGGESIFQPVVRRDEELSYYDAELTPWTLQDDNLPPVVDLSKAADESEREAEKTFKALNKAMVDSLKNKNLRLVEYINKPSSPSRLEFQELKQLAKQMGQYLGPGLY